MTKSRVTPVEITKATPKPFTRKTALVLPTFSLKAIVTGQSLFIQVDSPITNKADIDQNTDLQKTDKKGRPAELHLVNVTDLTTGEAGQMVLPFIIHRAFLDYEAANGKLIGACFELVKGKAEANKATFWEIYEIDA